MTEAQALAKLETLCNPTAYPELSPAELLSFLNDTKRFATHAVSTAYAVGTAVVPATANGRLYQCIVAGTSGSTAPVWPTTYYRLYQRIPDGTAVWQDIGPAYVETYNVTAAARLAWTRKAALAAADIDTSDQDQSTKASQVQAQCLTMARRYGPRFAL